jgi:hypothetical protein
MVTDADSLVKAALKSNQFDEQLCSNVHELLTILGPYSSNKAALLHLLSENIPAKYAAELFDVPARTITAAKLMTDEELHKTLLFVRQRSGKRRRISENEFDKFKEFLYIWCPTPSGSKVEKFVQTLPIQELYHEFLQWREYQIEQEEQQAISTVERELNSYQSTTTQQETSIISNQAVIHRFTLRTFSSLLKKFKEFVSTGVGQTVQSVQLSITTLKSSRIR